MEKIWIKKELYMLNYEFLKFYAFSDFSLIFKFIFYVFFLFKITKKGGVILVHRPPYADVASWHGEAATWRAGPPTDATWLWGHVAGPQVAHAWRMNDTCTRVTIIIYII